MVCPPDSALERFGIVSLNALLTVVFSFDCWAPNFVNGFSAVDGAGRMLIFGFVETAADGVAVGIGFAEDGESVEASADVSCVWTGGPDNFSIRLRRIYNKTPRLATAIMQGIHGWISQINEPGPSSPYLEHLNCWPAAAVGSVGRSP